MLSPPNPVQTPEHVRRGANTGRLQTQTREVVCLI